jgi:CHAT domain-containing protein/tetratricopeptide (TPR) repeat protein
VTPEEPVPLVDVDDPNLDAVLDGEGRATPELIDTIDADLSVTTETIDDAVAAVAYVASLHLASTDRRQWRTVRQLADSTDIAVEEIALRVQAGLAGDRVAAAAAEALATILLTRLSADTWRQLPTPIIHVLGAAALAGSRARPVRRRAWARVVFELLITTATSAESGFDDDTWIRLVHLFADITRTSADTVGDSGLYQVALDALSNTLSSADALGVGVEHRRRLARTCLASVRHQGPVELLDRGLRAALDAADFAEGATKIDLQDLAARIHSLRADLDTSSDDRRAAIRLWTDAISTVGPVRADGLGVRLRVNLASELGLLAKATGDECILRQSIAMYYAARRARPTRDEHPHILAGLANRYRQLYDLTSRREHLDRSIDLGRKSVDAIPDDIARSIAVNNQATRYRRRYEDFGDPDDIDVAIILAERAVMLMPSNRIEYPRWLANLSQHYRLRAELTGDRSDITKARVTARTALRSGGDRDDGVLDAYVSAELLTPGLSVRRLDRLVRLTESAAERQGSPSQVALRHANVAHVRARRFEQTGSPEDAERAAGAWDTALANSSRTHVDHVGMLTQAGAGAELLYEATGDPSWLLRAVERHRQALHVAGSRGLSGPVTAVINVNLANSLARHGEVVLSRDDLDEAIRAAERAVRTASATQREAAHTALGGALLARHEHQAEQEGRARAADGRRAIAQYRAAYAAAPTDRSRRAAAGNIANALFHVGYTLGDLTLLNESTHWYQLATTATDPGDTAAAIRLTNLGFAALTVAGSEPDATARQRHLAVAEQAFDDASRTSGALVDLRVALGRARTAAAKGAWSAAADAAENAARAFQESAASFTGGRYAQSTLRLGAPAAALGALAHIRSGNTDHAVTHLERTRGILLRSEMLHASAAVEAFTTTGDIDSAQRLRTLIQEARVLDSRLSEHATDADRVTLRALRATIDSLTVTAYPALSQVDTDATPDASAARALARTGTPLAYLIGDDHGGVVVLVEPDGTMTAHDAPELATRVAGRRARTFRRLMLDQTTVFAQQRFRTALGNLLQDLGGTVGRLLQSLTEGSGRLIIVPVGPLAGIPWHAMEIEGQPLLRSTEVTYQPTATLGLAASRRPRPPRSRWCTVSFVPDDDRRWSMTAEAAAVARQWRGHARSLDIHEITGDVASIASVGSAFANSAVAHVAAHALERPLVSESGIVLADGALSARRLLATGAPSELMFLAACSTGKPLLEDEEQFTVAAAGLAAGALSVISTLWPVPDVAGPIVAARFYDAWLAGASAAAALRATQLQMLDDSEFRDPLFWAPYTVTGG